MHNVTVVLSFADGVIPSCLLLLCVVSLVPQHFVHDLSVVLHDPCSFVLFLLFFPVLPHISLSQDILKGGSDPRCGQTNAIICHLTKFNSPVATVDIAVEVVHEGIIPQGHGVIIVLLTDSRIVCEVQLNSSKVDR